ncbi:MAG: AmmeMemoRadiSam system radical SAM enzyme [Phycisphaerae bacterium]|nr:AmmeMemoRadiSam system radical SAM enzyme [Phycisphaerae bacterium]
MNDKPESQSTSSRAGREALLYEALDGQTVRCELCGHACVIAGGKYGLCRVRENVAGVLMSRNYGRLVAVHVDPIEKKPLFHVLPGSRSLSVAAAGCNFQCEFCQNWPISQAPRDGEALGEAVSPEQIVTAAMAHDCRSISYTYTEPTVFFEMALDAARLAKAKGLFNCFVSNGFLTPLAIATIRPWLDAINVDLKAFRDATYRRVMKARLEPVLTALRSLTAAGVWVEVTTLVVPGMNDSEAELRDIAAFIANELGRHVPWHVSRFHGDYRMTATPTTPTRTMQRACELGIEAGLHYVYAGNAQGLCGENTHCPDCRRLLIGRAGFVVGENALVSGACPDCGRRIEGIWG